MPRVRISAAALNDSEQIAAWIAQNNPFASDHWLDALQNQFEKLAETPGSGTDRSYLRPGLRSSPFGHYLIFYKPLRNGVRIVRVIHGAQNYERFFR